VASDLRERQGGPLAVIHSMDHGTAADRQKISTRVARRPQLLSALSREQIQQILVRKRFSRIRHERGRPFTPSKIAPGAGRACRNSEFKPRPAVGCRISWVARDK